MLELVFYADYTYTIRVFTYCISSMIVIIMTDTFLISCAGNALGGTLRPSYLLQTGVWKNLAVRDISIAPSDAMTVSSSLSSRKFIRRPLQGLSGAVQYSVNRLHNKDNSNVLKTKKSGKSLLHLHKKSFFSFCQRNIW